jgi:hypothetical protein
LALPVRCGIASQDGACGSDNQRRLGLQRIAAGLSSLAEISRCSTTSEDSTGDIFGLLARWRRLAFGGSNEMISNLCGDFGLIRFPRAGAPLRATSTTILEMSPKRGAVWRVGGPCARVRRAEWRVGGPRARESCFRLDVLYAVRWSIRVQQHCGGGSCTTVGPSVRWCLSLCSSICNRLLFRVTTLVSEGGAAIVFSLLSSLCVQSYGRVDVPIRPTIAYSCVVTRVEVPIQPGELLFFFFSFSCLWSPRTIVLYSFCYINETRIVLCGSL